MEWYRLRVVGVKDSSIRNLIKKFKDYQDIFKLDRFYLEKYCKIDQKEIEKIYLSKSINLDEELKKLQKEGIGVLFIEDKNYPRELKNISHPPIFLYYQGDISLLREKKIGVVGTRKATAYGKAVCEKMVNGLVEANIVTVSGLALGIDSICHKRTLEKNGKTIAVVGSGLDVIYPKENKSLWYLIKQNGLILSEYPLGTEPFMYNFPMRNRIIVGISQGVLVVESQKKGGSLISAELALEEGREVFAIPGDIFSPASEGCNNLIKNSQAKLVLDVDDILIEFGWKKENKNTELELNLTEYEKKIYNILEREKSLDEIIQQSGMKAGEILSILMDLELKKIVSSVAGGKYRRKK